jgi:3-dehydroquinate dehydratase type I
MRPQICTSIRPNRLNQIGQLIHLAFEKGSDFVEVRFDYLKAPDPNVIRKEVPNQSKCIFTCRPSWDGGFFRGSEEERFKLLSSLISLDPAYIDVELDALRSRELWATQLSKTSLIVSYHNRRETPTLQSLRRIWNEASNLGAIVKIATTAKSVEDNFTVLTLCTEVAPGKLVTFCMGDKGVLSRVLCPLLGSPFTYASLEGRRTASGQLSLDKLKGIYKGMMKFERQS